MPADGDTVARDIGLRVPGGEKTGLVKAWSPDGRAVLVRAENTTAQTFSIDPLANEYCDLPWKATDLPDVRRLAP